FDRLPRGNGCHCVHHTVVRIPFMSGDSTKVPTSDELAGMTQEELARLGAQMDGVELREYGPRQEPGSPAEKRAERIVAKWFLLAALFALAFVVIFIAWPWEYQDALNPDGSTNSSQRMYAVYTPLLGIT